MNTYKNETLDSAGAPVLGSEWGHLAFCTSRIERVVYFSATKTASTLPVSKATYYSRRLAPRPPPARTARAKPRARTPSRQRAPRRSALLLVQQGGTCAVFLEVVGSSVLTASDAQSNARRVHVRLAESGEVVITSPRSTSGQPGELPPWRSAATYFE